MNKRLLFRLLTLAMLITTAVSASAYDFYADGFYYNITSSVSVSVTHSGPYSSDYSGDVKIPPYVVHDGVVYRVSSIAEGAFYECGQMTSITIPSTVNYIESEAFYYCTGLTMVYIPESVTTIEDWNFYKSDELTTVILPSTIRELGGQVFGSCAKLSKVTCKATTPPTTGSGCFASLSSKTLYVPESAVSAYQSEGDWNSWFNYHIDVMPEYDFSYVNLKFVITGTNTAMCIGPKTEPYGSWSIPDMASYNGVNYYITAVGKNAFINCTHLNTLTIGNYVETLEPYAFYLCTGLNTVDLGNVVRIEDAAFGDCWALTDITIPNTVTVIGDIGFGSSGLVEVTIPASVHTLSNRPFSNCQSLTTINVDGANPFYTARDGVLYSKDMTRLINYPCGDQRTAFTVPSGVETICHESFAFNKYLTKVTLPKSVTVVDYMAFADMPALTDFTCLATTPPGAYDSSFSSTIENSGLTLTVPKQCKSAYEAANIWRDFPNIVEQYYDFMHSHYYYNITGENTVEVTCDNPNGGTYDGYESISVPDVAIYDGKFYDVTAVGSNAFSECHNLKEVELPSTITSINWGAFYNCYLLAEINLPENLTSIGTYAFYSCNVLKDLKIPASVNRLGVYAFCHCGSLTEITIPKLVTSIEYGTFYACTNLAKVTIGEGVTRMGEDVFKSCPALTSIISHAVTPPTIASNTFESSHYSNAQLWVPKGSRSAYRAADYWKNFTNISEVPYDFEECGIYYNILSSNPASVEVTYMSNDYDSYSGEVNIPETVTHGGTTYTVTAIGNSAFRLSRSLTAVTIPNTVTTIGNYAFYYCQGLTHVVIPNSVTTIGHYAFWLCTGLQEAIIPNSVTTMGMCSFRNCSSLRQVVIGKNVTSIGETSFYYCPDITEVTCLAATPPTLYDSGTNTTFPEDVYHNAVLRVPYGSHEDYLNHSGWGRFDYIVSEEYIEPSTAGDVNGDGHVTISDVTALINYLLSHNATGLNLDATDVNGDHIVNISDVTSLINRLLSGNTSGETVGNARSNYLINNAPFSMIRVEGGTFMMGLEGDNAATPVHQVTLPDYSIGETELTQIVWEAVMGNNPSNNQSHLFCPVENIEWDDCLEFTRELSRLTGKYFRLPTEAEWEFAARGGNKSQGYIYPGSDNISEVAWNATNSNNTTHIVGNKHPNELGLFDMSGNVFEWCHDYYARYTSEAQFDPQGPESGETRVCRSAGYNRPSNSNWFKCGGRTHDAPTSKAPDTGMRLACVSDGEVASYTAGNSVNDHLFVRWASVDNEYPFEGTGIHRIGIWLDDDQIYTNAAVQALTPQSYNADGDPYNEITYNAMQFELYVPQDIEIVNTQGIFDINGGPRLPLSANISCNLLDGTTIIDGVIYKKYFIMITNWDSYGTHFSGIRPQSYEQDGALKKNDGPLLYIYFKRVPGMLTPAGDQEIIIANTHFSIQEAIAAGWSSSERDFFYGTGGDNASPRFQKYVRVKLKH